MRKGLRTIASVGLGVFLAGSGCKGSEPRIGQACDLTVDAGPSQTVVDIKSSACSTGICLKPAQDPDGIPQVPPTGATCTALCAYDSDCEGATRDSSNPEDTRCASGFVCRVPFTVSPVCCQKLCICKDFLPQSAAAVPIVCQGNTAGSCIGTETYDVCATGETLSTEIWQQTDLSMGALPTDYVCAEPKLFDLDLCSGNNDTVGTDHVIIGLTPNCHVFYRTPRTSDGQIVYDDSALLPMCEPSDTVYKIQQDCWQLTLDRAKCPNTAERISVLRTAAELAAGPLPDGTTVKIQCRTCPDLVSVPGCD
jgi:hypothetical protein